MVSSALVRSGLLFVLGALLSGCVMAALEEADMLGVKTANVADYSYAAADTLLDDAKEKDAIIITTPLRFEKLQAIKSLDPKGRLANLIPSHMSTRATERGYFAIDTMQDTPPALIVSGTYTMVHPYILVSLRMTRASDGMRISATEFKLPLTRNVRELVALPPVGVSLSDEGYVRARKEVEVQKKKWAERQAARRGAPGSVVAEPLPPPRYNP